MAGLLVGALSCENLQFDPKEQYPFCRYILHSLVPASKTTDLSFYYKLTQLIMKVHIDSTTSISLI